MCMFTAGNTDLNFFLREQLELWPKYTNLSDSLAYSLNDGESVHAGPYPFDSEHPNVKQM